MTEDQPATGTPTREQAEELQRRFREGAQRVRTPSPGRSGATTRALRPAPAPRPEPQDR